MEKEIDIDADDAVLDASDVITPLVDADDYNGDPDPSRSDLKNIFKGYFDKILATLGGAIGAPGYHGQLLACASGLAVGDPVYLSASNTVAKADSTTEVKADVIGFVRYKPGGPTGTTCILNHFIIVTGGAGSWGKSVFLKDDASFGYLAGTVPCVLGRWITNSIALLFIPPTGALIAPRRIQITKTIAYTLKLSDCGKTFIDTGAISSPSGRALTAPQTADIYPGYYFRMISNSGNGFHFARDGAQNIYVAGNAYEYFYIDGFGSRGTAEFEFDGTDWHCNYFTGPWGHN